jgi:hypothetical protein
MQPVDDAYSLMEWLKAETLKAHNHIEECKNSCHGKDCEEDDGCCMSSSCEWSGRKTAYETIITHIQNGRVNQRPHVKERI